MAYQEYVYEVFRDHHDCMGMDEEEISELIEETSFAQIEKWLTKSGYDLNEYYSD
ncbi:hypothetical protein [Peribacillus loiseleuriae]|uniref:hypothetical protein n=1 Tax=Peribacillus loiseleuriae TaxID=1679170 RepID=UPI000A522AA4|nr:hypothetical protein [Peribacillus loiseleuriae]